MARAHSLPEEEGHNFLASVSDLMASLLFVFILLLLLFALQLQQATAKREETVERQTSALRTRSLLLSELKGRLKALGFAVEIDERQGVLRLTEDFIRFESGRTHPRLEHLPHVDKLAGVLAEVAPCFTKGWEDSCHDPVLRERRSSYASNLDVLMIEGHTDDVRCGCPFNSERGCRRHDEGYDRDCNLELSTTRASNIYRRFVETQPSLEALRSTKGDKLLSVSGYAYWRPIPGRTPDDPLNRRIDLRFIMEPPGLPPPAQETGQRLEEGSDGG